MKKFILIAFLAMAMAPFVVSAQSVCRNHVVPECLVCISGSTIQTTSIPLAGRKEIAEDHHCRINPAGGSNPNCSLVVDNVHETVLTFFSSDGCKMWTYRFTATVATVTTGTNDGRVTFKNESQVEIGHDFGLCSGGGENQN